MPKPSTKRRKTYVLTAQNITTSIAAVGGPPAEAETVAVAAVDIEVAAPATTVPRFKVSVIN